MTLAYDSLDGYFLRVRFVFPALTASMALFETPLKAVLICALRRLMPYTDPAISETGPIAALFSISSVICTFSTSSVVLIFFTVIIYEIVLLPSRVSIAEMMRFSVTSAFVGAV